MNLYMALIAIIYCWHKYGRILESSEWGWMGRGWKGLEILGERGWYTSDGYGI